MEQHFQDVDQNSMNDNNLDSIADHFANYFTQRPIQKQCCKIMSFEILSTVNPIG